MSSCFPPALHESAALFRADMAHVAREGADTCSRIAAYLLAAYHAISGLLAEGGRHALRAIEWIDTHVVGTLAGTCGWALFKVFSAVELAAMWVHDQIGTLFSAVAYGVAKVGRGIASFLVDGAKKTARFYKDNWKSTLRYLLAWGVIVGGSGLLYGFKAVALPMTIGFGIGIVPGALSVAATRSVFEKEPFWDQLNGLINKISENGTRQLLMAVSISILTAATVVYPHALGILFGFLIGNQTVDKIVTGRDYGPSPQAQRHRLRTLRQQLQDCEQLLNRLVAEHEEAEHEQT